MIHPFREIAPPRPDCYRVPGACGASAPDNLLVIYPQSEYSYPMKSNIGNAVMETESFIKQAAAVLSTAELDELKDYVARNPLAGDELPGTGGLRKLRWGRAGMGSEAARE